jgi:hypothetical protein
MSPERTLPSTEPPKGTRPPVWPEKWQTIFAGLIFLVTTVYGVTAIYQWRTMKRQAEIMSNQVDTMNKSLEQTQILIRQQQELLGYAGIQANASLKQADASLAQATAAVQSVRISQASATAAEQSANVASQSFTVGERPYIAINHIKLEGLRNNMNPNVELSFENSGKTPALNVRARSYTDFRHDVRLGEVDYPGVPLLSSAFVQAGHSFRQFFPIFAADLKPDNVMKLIDAINHKQLWLFVYGIVEYDDGAVRHHTLKFCQIYAVDLSEFHVCTEHNTSN